MRSRRGGPSAVGAVLTGAAMGSASGPVTACEVAAALAAQQVGVVTLLQVPSTAEDFAAGGQAPLEES